MNHRNVETLSAEQRPLAILSFVDEKRVDWQFIPLETCKSLPLRDMNEMQRSAGFGMLRNFQKDPQGSVANHIHSIWRDMTGDFNLPRTA